MKKKNLVSLFAMVTLCLTVMIMSTACFGKHPIEKFLDKMEDVDSYQMLITFTDVPIFGTFTMLLQVDGNIQYDGEEYIEEVDGVKYSYTKDDSGKWSKEVKKVEDDDNSSNLYSDETFNKLFNPENYEKVDGEKNTYKQKSDVDFGEFKNVTMIVEKDSCTIEMSMISEGVVMGAKIVISEFDNIDLTLPVVA